MNRRTFLATAAAAPAVLSSQTEDGFVSLFDGKSLGGWSVRDGAESAFYVRDGDIVVHTGDGYPAWLRSDRQYENFDFRGEFYIKGWIDSGIYIHAPEHGRNTWVGYQIHLFHQRDEKPAPESMGAIFPLVPPLKVNVRNEWNTFRILMDWPRLRVWTNDEAIQDLDLTSVPELRRRLRRGYLGFASLSYPIRFRNLRIRELPAKETWQSLYTGPEDFAKWHVTEGKPGFEPLNQVLCSSGVGHLGTRERFRDFEMQLYIRHTLHHNGGVLFRSAGEGSRGRHYEIQLHDVEGAHYPTGSLYHFKRAQYPRIEAGKWFLMQLLVQGSNCLVRINGDTVLEYDKLENLDEGLIELQAHDLGRWTEYKQILIKRL